MADDEEYSLEMSESVSDDDEVSEQSETHDVVSVPKDRIDALPMKYDNDKLFPNGGCGRGVVHIFNNYKFTSKDPKKKLDDFENGHKDGRRLSITFGNMSYKVKLWENLTKKETEDAFKRIQRTKGLKKEFSLIFFILSHGSNENTFFSGDSKPIDLMKIMVLFRKDHCPAMKIKPTFWFGDFCRGDKDQRGTGPYTYKSSAEEPDMQIYGTKECLQRVKYVMSSNPGMISVTDGNGNSCFTYEICKMLRKDSYACHSLDDDWFSELDRRLRKKNCPNTHVRTYNPFPGPLFHGIGFSFKFDLEKVAQRSPYTKGHKLYPLTKKSPFSVSQK